MRKKETENRGGVKGLNLKYILQKNLFLGAFRLHFGGPTASDILSLDPFYKGICPWIFWRDEVLKWGFEEVRSLCKMSISHKKTFFSQFWLYIVGPGPP